MEKRGTGWIPDYPDVNDYTLNSETIQNLANRIQSQGSTTSIDNLAKKVYEALDILAKQQKNQDVKIQLNNIRNDLNKEILGDLSFVTVKFHNVFKEGMADSEVLLIKNYLQSIFAAEWKNNPQVSKIFNENVPEGYKPLITDITFDPNLTEAFKTVKKVISTTQEQEETDGLVDKYNIETLKLLADISRLNFYEDANPVIQLVKKGQGRKNADEQIAFVINFYKIFENIDHAWRACRHYLLEEKLQQERETIEIEEVEQRERFLLEYRQRLKEKKNQAKTSVSLLANLTITTKKKYAGHADFLKENIPKKDGKISSSFENLEKLLNDPEILFKKINELEKILEDVEKFADSADPEKEFVETAHIRNELMEELVNLIIQICRMKPPQISSNILEEKIESILSPIALPVFELLMTKLLTIKISESKNSQLKLDDKAVQKFICSVEKEENQQQSQKLIISIIEVIGDFQKNNCPKTIREKMKTK